MSLKYIKALVLVPQSMKKTSFSYILFNWQGIYFDNSLLIGYKLVNCSKTENIAGCSVIELPFGVSSTG
jgi:hypothetical protein